MRPRNNAFTLLELLVVIAIVSILASLLLPALAASKRKARMIEEISSARQLILAVHLYAEENEDAVFPGYMSQPNARDDQGELIPFPTNARYPWRLLPFLSQSLETIYCGPNRARLQQLRQFDRREYVYAVSVYPSLGINSYFIGGNETEFPAAAANNRFGYGTVVTRMSEIQRPSTLMGFASARSAVDGLEANGYYQVTPPYLTDRLWAENWSPDMPPKDWGFVAPRYSRRAVTAAMDGHSAARGLTDLQDMQRWCNNADRSDFTLAPNGY
jgi:prepilin-type N-terminal cleavage/methylation domain-containing protein